MSVERHDRSKWMARMGHGVEKENSMRQYERWILEWFQRNLTHNDPTDLQPPLLLESYE